MRIVQAVRSVLRDALSVYWTLVKIIVPVMVLTRLAVELGVIEALAPLLSPMMTLLGLPPELGFAWLTGIFVGIWGGALAMFTVVPVDKLTTAQVTVFCSLLLFTHALPIEQRIVQQAGPGFVATTVLRLLGGFLYGLLLSLTLAATGWLGAPATPHWVPVSPEPGWLAFLRDTVETLVVMFVILVALIVAMRLIKRAGLEHALTVALAPVLRLAGLGPKTVPFTIVGIMLGLSYGGGLIIREAREGHLAPRELFLACVFMGFAHSLIEDTLVVVALGADAAGVLLGRIVFTILAVAVVARLLALVPEHLFLRVLFTPVGRAPAPEG